MLEMRESEKGAHVDFAALGDVLRDRIPPAGAVLDASLFVGKRPQEAGPLIEALSLALRYNREVSLSFLHVEMFEGNFAEDLLRGMKERIVRKYRDRIEFYALSEEIAGELDFAARRIKERAAH
jgi:hypothetical protein